jgi:Family of unknown function (DUF6220)
MRRAFTGLAILLAVVVLAQFFFAATGAFSSAPNEESFQPHRALGYVVFLVPVVMTIVAALARLPRRLVGWSALVAALVVVQVLIAKLAEALGDTGGSTAAGPLVFGVHAVNGLVILALTGMIVRATGRLRPASPSAR